MTAFEIWWIVFKVNYALNCIKDEIIAPTANDMKSAMEAVEPYKDEYKKVWMAFKAVFQQTKKETCRGETTAFYAVKEFVEMSLRSEQ